MNRPDFGELMGLSAELTGNLLDAKGAGRLAVVCREMQRFIELLEERIEEQAAAAKFSPDQRVWYTPPANKKRVQTMPAIVVCNAGARIRVRLPAAGKARSRVCQVSPSSLGWVDREESWSNIARQLAFP